MNKQSFIKLLKTNPEYFTIAVPELGKETECSRNHDGSVWNHTLCMVKWVLKEYPDDIVLITTVLFHDVGKPACQTWDEAKQKYRFFDHDKIGAVMLEYNILNRRMFDFLTDEDKAGIVWLVKNHMVAHTYANTMNSPRYIRKFIEKNMSQEAEGLGSDPVTRFAQLGQLAIYDTFSNHPGDEKTSDDYKRHECFRNSLVKLATEYID